MVLDVTMTASLSPDNAIPGKRALSDALVDRLLDLAETFRDPSSLFQLSATLAADIGQDRGYVRERVSKPLAEFVLNLVGADAAYVRERESDDTLPLLGDQTAVAWRDGLQPEGAVPKKKWREDGPCNDFTDVSGGNREEVHKQSARNRNCYEAIEHQFMNWIGSEAWIPIKLNGQTVAVVLVVKHESNFFTPHKLELMRRYQGFVQAFYHLASSADDRNDTVRVLRHVAAILPRFAEAPSLPAFWRAICALMTCHCGFKFNRAVLFWMHAHSYPAVAEMAVGDLGDQDPNVWRAQCEIIKNQFPTLDDYIQSAFEQPEPTEDRLYQAIKAKPLTFSSQDAGLIQQQLADKLSDDVVQKLADDEPWIEAVRSSHPGVLQSKHGEYFVFPLVPLNSKKERSVYGFVVADLAFEPRKHFPGPGNPNLGIVQLVLKLIVGMWEARDKSDSYLHVLAALPVLRHDAPALDLPISWIERELAKDPTTWNVQELRKQSKDATDLACRLRAAAEIVEDNRRREQSHPIAQLHDWLTGKATELEGRYRGNLQCICTLDKAVYNGSVRMTEHFLDSILTCVADNAVEAGDGASVRKITITSRLSEVPEGSSQRGKRVVIRVENDGPEIPEELVPFLFVNRVSTRDPKTKHRGSGLSSARLLAQAFGGDVVLLCREPSRVAFGIVLHMVSPQ